MTEKKLKTEKSDWVFWFEIRRRYWWKWFWTNRGSNFFEIQVLGFRISIGQPWLRGHTIEYIKSANAENLKYKHSILIKRS